MKNASCYYCENRHNLNTQGFSSTLSSEYTLLSEYKGLDEKVLVKHSCGFVWSVVPRKLYNYRGCPKCNKKRSQGERRITQYLDEKQLDYDIEHRFSWQTNPLRRYDFFLPDYNLIIEYNGEQHYKETHFFETDLTTQEQIDIEKYNDAVRNGLNYLVIPYTTYNNIENILDDETTFRIMCVVSTYGRGIESAILKNFDLSKGFVFHLMTGNGRMEIKEKYKNTPKEKRIEIGREYFHLWQLQSYSNNKIKEEHKDLFVHYGIADLKAL